MAYELKQSDIFDFARFVGAEYKQKGDELFFKFCPYCGGGHDRDKESFSINLVNGAFKCFRSTCGKQGHFVQAARDFGYKLDFEPTEKQYKQLPQKRIEVRDSAVEYMKSRGISEAVCRAYRITSQKNKQDILVLPFYDENGELVTVKYRNTKFVKGKTNGSKEWFERDTKPILFGMDKATDFEKPLIITEGQIDALSLVEVGLPNAVSVPTGANGMTWVQHCYEWVDKFREIVIFGDHEKGKITLVDAIAKKFPQKHIRCVRPQDYLMEKDANDILRKYGADALKQAIENAEPVSTCRLKDLADVESVDIFSMERIFTGIRQLDRLLGGLYYGQVVILTGKNGNGKSTVMSQIIVNALDKGINTMIYSGELTDYHFKRWLDLQAAGDDYVVERQNRFGDKSYTITPEISKQISDWYRGKAWIYDNTIVTDAENECDELLDTIELSIVKFGARFICLDNLMTALDVPLGDDLYRAQSKFLKRLKKIAQQHNVIIMLVAHPRKSRSDSITKDDIAGSGDITNRVDVVLTYTRDAEKEDIGYIEVKKNRLTGVLTKPDEPIVVSYSKKSKRICGDGTPFDVAYGWLKSDSGKMVVPDSNGDLPF